MRDWLCANQSYDGFWNKTPREIGIILCAVAERERADFENKRVLNFELAQLIAYAFNSPKDMPEYHPIPAQKPIHVPDPNQEMFRYGLRQMAINSQKGK